MTAVERRHIPKTLLIGGVLTLTVVVLNHVEALRPLERWLYDQRVRYCQFFTPPPIDDLVHLDIDDKAMATIGSWPWDRHVLAVLLEEIDRADPRLIALDIMLPDAQGEADEVLGQTIGRLDNVLMPIAGIERKTRKPIEVAAFDLLFADLELTQDELVGDLEAQGFSPRSLPPERIAQLFIRARESATYDRVMKVLARAGQDQQPTFDALRATLLPRTDALVTGSANLRLLRREFDRARTVRSLWRFTQPKSPDHPPLRVVDIDQPPVLPLAQHVAASGFVDYYPDPDGTVRRVPLWIEADGRLFPQMGLMLACASLDVDLADVRILVDRVVLPLPDGTERVIPVRTEQSNARDGEPIGTLMAVPWFGPARWQQMYAPRTAEPAKAGAFEEPLAPRHIAITAVWDVLQLRQRIAANQQSVDKAAWVMLGARGDSERFFPFQLRPDEIETYLGIPFESRTIEQRAVIVSKAIAIVSEFELDKQFESIEGDLAAIDADDTLTPQQKSIEKRRWIEAKEEFDAAWHVLRQVPQETTGLVTMIDQRRAMLAQTLRDRIVLIGWIATGRLDEERTSLHASCPGVVIHGVIYNGIVTGHNWSTAPRHVGSILTLLLGLLATGVAAVWPPSRALLVLGAVAAGYLVINGVVLFDRHDMIVGAAGPLVGVAIVWAGCTLWRFLAERTERARLTRQFRSYVDPALVNYLMELPTTTILIGQSREMTVVFTDLAGFTTLSERLREKTVPLLNDYMGRMVKIIRPEDRPAQRRGYVNKFLGDGIMFFFGAPYDNRDHAHDAVDTVLRMQAAMEPFNADLIAQGLPTVSMRVGVSTGDMIVGDAGPREASDYTVLGDAVNLAARLESANKATGTRILINETAREHIGDAFLVRPVGRLQVVGKADHVMTYEPLCRAEDATDNDRRLASLAESIVNNYMSANFTTCRAALDAMESQVGADKFTALYRAQLDRLGDTPPAGFDGRIVLESK